MSKKSEKIIGGLFGFVFIVVGIAFCFKGVSYIFKNYDVSDWKRTRGVVISQSEFNPGGSNIRDCHEKVNVLVEYSYKVNGREYISSRLSYDPQEQLCENRKSYKEFKLKYAPQTSHEVYYNPENPADSVLTRDSIFISSMFILAGILLFIVPGGFIVFVCLTA